MKTTEIVCKHCNQTFVARQAEVNRGNAIYCSQQCNAAHQLIIRADNLATHKCKHCGDKFMSHSKYSKYCSQSCKLKNYRVKKKSTNMYDSQLEDTIREYSCEICNWNECTRDVHHIIPVAKGGKSIYTNLISLCPNHHKMADLKLLSQDYLLKIVKYRTISSSLSLLLSKIAIKEQDANLVIKEIKTPPVVSEPS